MANTTVYVTYGTNTTIILSNNSTNASIVTVSSPGVMGPPAPLEVFIGDKPGPGEMPLRYLVIRESMDILSDISLATAENASTGSSVFTVYKNANSIGTFTFPPGSNSAITTFSNTHFSYGDVLKLTCPLVVDATLKDITFAFGLK